MITAEERAAIEAVHGPNVQIIEFTEPCTDCPEAIRLRQMEIMAKHRRILGEVKPCGCKDAKTGKEYVMGQFGKARTQADRSIVYVRKGVEPPPDIDGYRRDPGNAWRFIPEWQPCTARIQNKHIKSCGAVGILTICNNEALPIKGKEIDFNTCQNCVNRCQ